MGVGANIVQQLKKALNEGFFDPLRNVCKRCAVVVRHNHGTDELDGVVDTPLAALVLPVVGVRLDGNCALVVLCIEHIHNCSPVCLVKACGRIVVTYAVDVKASLDVEVVDLVAPVADLSEVVAVAAVCEAMRYVVLDTKLGKCTEYDLPFLIAVYEVVPAAVIDGDLYAQRTCVFEKDAEVFDCLLEVIVVGKSLYSVASAAEYGAAHDGCCFDAVLILFNHLSDDVTLLVKACCAPTADGCYGKTVLFGESLCFGSESEETLTVRIIVAAELNAVELKVLYVLERFFCPAADETEFPCVPPDLYIIDYYLI